MMEPSVLLFKTFWSAVSACSWRIKNISSLDLIFWTVGASTDLVEFQIRPKVMSDSTVATKPIFRRKYIWRPKSFCFRPGTIWACVVYSKIAVLTSANETGSCLSPRKLRSISRTDCNSRNSVAQSGHASMWRAILVTSSAPQIRSKSVSYTHLTLPTTPYV